MNETLKILILEDDANDRAEFLQCAKETKDVSIVGCTANADEALTIFQNECPNAVIIDLELHNGIGNGLQFLSSLQTCPHKNQAFLLITTNNSSHTTHETARKLGADFILTKYETDYSAQYVIDFLKMMHSTICSKNTCSDSKIRPVSVDTSAVSADSQNYVYDIPETELLSFIRDEIIQIGVSPKSVGFRYLSDAVLIKLQDANANIYNVLGPKYKKSDPSIERAMQYAINRAWRTGDPDELLANYTARVNSERGVPTIMEFVFFYVSKTKNKFNIK